MIYPQKLSNKKRKIIINILFIVSIVFSIILIIINKITSPNINWSQISIAGILYLWITVIYSIKRNTNIASHILLQMLLVSALVLYVDDKLNFQGWSIYIGIPIIVIVANATMLLLSIISYKNYTKYVIHQLVIVLLSINQIFLVVKGIIEFRILNIISIGISLINFIISLFLSYKEFYNVLKCKFHM